MNILNFVLRESKPYMHKYSDNCPFCKIYSGLDTFELTPEEKSKLLEIDKDFKKQDEEYVSVIDKYKISNDEDLKRIKEILLEVTDNLPKIDYLVTLGKDGKIEYINEELKKEVLDKLDPKKLEEYEYLDARTRSRYKKAKDITIDFSKTINFLKIVSKLESFLKDDLKLKINKSFDNFIYDYGNKTYHIFLGFKQDIYQQVEKNLKTMKKKNEKKVTNKIVDDPKFKQIVEKYDLKVHFKTKGGFTLTVDEGTGEKYDVSSTGNLRYYNDRYSQGSLILSSNDNIKILDKIDENITKRRKKMEKK
jgi:hypothetical protein